MAKEEKDDSACWKTENGLFVSGFRHAALMPAVWLPELKKRFAKFMKEEGREDQKKAVSELISFASGLGKDDYILRGFWQGEGEGPGNHGSGYSIIPFDAEMGWVKGKERAKSRDHERNKDVLSKGKYGLGMIGCEVPALVARLPGLPATVPGHGAASMEEMANGRAHWDACRSIAKQSALINKGLKAMGMPSLPKGFVGACGKLERVDQWTLMAAGGRANAERLEAFAVWSSSAAGFMNKASGCFESLARATMHESDAAARRAAKYQRIHDGFVVRVRLGLEEVSPLSEKSESEELRAVLAANEEAELKAALEKASIERLRSRLAEIEAANPTGEAPAAPTKPRPRI